MTKGSIQWEVRSEGEARALQMNDMFGLNVKYNSALEEFKQVVA